MKNYIFIVDHTVYRKGLDNIENNVRIEIRNIVYTTVHIIVLNIVWDNVYENV
jgi:hypothetical protein